MHDFEVVWECAIAELREKKEVRDFLSSFVYEVCIISSRIRIPFRDQLKP